MRANFSHIAPCKGRIFQLIGIAAFILFCSINGYSQNTKGDRPPVKNQKTVRQTKAKSYKKKEKGSTRDIAGRRLRTKDQSSANRANAKYPQPSPYSRRISKQPERAAKPTGRVFTKSPKETKRRAWKGDVSGYALRRVHPTNSDAARNNVYPQKGPFVRYARKRPKEEKPPVYSKTIRGRSFVRHKPHVEERAWKGGADHGPIKNQSATGLTRNTYSQRGPYVAYKRKKQGKDKSVSNNKEIAQVKKLSRPPGTRPGNAPLTPSATHSFMQRGKKNVYWGKYQRKEKGVTTDLTGGPLRTRNYKSMTPGLIGRDSLKYFGRKPFGESSKGAAGGYQTATGKGQRGWKGDIAGWQLRKSAKGKKEVAGKFFFRRKLSISSNVNRSERVPGSGYETRTKRGEKAQLNSVPGIVYDRPLSSKKMKGVKSPRGAGGAARYSGTFTQRRGFSLDGTGYSGNIKSGRRGFGQQGAGYSGNIKGGQRGFSQQGAGYSGNIKGGQRGFSQQGAGYSGNIKGGQRGFSQQGAGYSGNIKGGQRGFSQQGAGYSGNIKGGQRGFGQQGAGYSGNIKGGQRGFGQQGAGYSGNIKGGQRGFGQQGAGYSGNIKGGQRGFGQQGAGYSGNIKGGQRGFGQQGAGYSGNIKGGQRGFGEQGAGYSGNIKGFRVMGEQGAGYSGNLKRKRFDKGGGSVSGILWNNNNQAVTQKFMAPWEVHALRFSGNTKYKRPEKGGGSVSGILWNNNDQPITQKSISPAGLNALRFSGNTKYKRPEKGGGSVSGQLINNGFKPLPVMTPRSAAASAIVTSGRIPLRKKPIQNPNASRESLKKKSPSPTTFEVAGLQVKVRQRNYARKPNASKDALPGIAPTRATVKASEYANSMKQYWHYKHNPNSNRYALMGIAPVRATARIADYQGNMKMHKYSGSRLHPDAQFAHGYRDNVKGERTVMMNVKLLWGKLFRKNETQPENLKEKLKKPGYDKREKGLWND